MLKKRQCVNVKIDLPVRIVIEVDASRGGRNQNLSLSHLHVSEANLKYTHLEEVWGATPPPPGPR